MKLRVRVMQVNKQNLFVANTHIGFVAAYTWHMLWVKVTNPHHFPNGLVNPTLCKRMAVGGPLLVYRP